VSLKPRLVVIDGPPRSRGEGRVSQRMWGNDHEALRRLQRWALDHQLAVLCVCRTRAFRAEEQSANDDASSGLLALADNPRMTGFNLAAGETWTVSSLRGKVREGLDRRRGRYV